MTSRSCLCAAFLLLLAFQSASVKGTIVRPPQCREVPGTSAEKLQFALNLLILEAELYLRTSIGRGIDDIAPGLVQGPVPIGDTVANLDNVTRRIIEELGYQAIGNIRAILNTRLVTPIQRPQLNISARVFSDYINAAVGVTLNPPFNVSANTRNYVATVYNSPGLIQQYFAGILPGLVINDLERVAAGIQGTLSGRVGVIRTLAYLRTNETVLPYRFTVANLTNNVAQLLNRLGMCGTKDEGLLVALQLGAENRTTSNILAADVNSLTPTRTERELMRIVYGTGNATRPGGFFPQGFNGAIARRITLLRLS
ncbi:hypothetical protein DITRI_Ditri13aG0040500 [Diplodiscus trichospermus]